MIKEFMDVELGQRFKYAYKLFTKTASCAAVDDRGECVLFRERTKVAVDIADDQIIDQIASGYHHEKLFKGLPSNFTVTHYHSWAIKPETVPDELQVTARNNEGLIMAIAHKKFDVRGVQFHPESIMTEHGKEIIKNWINN